MKSIYDFRDAIIESNLSFINAQPTSDRLKYKAVLESSDPAGRAALVSKLYEFCIRPNNIDYGKIPDSRGNILKLQGYNTTSKAIELLNELMVMDNTQGEIKTLNDFHDMLLNCRSDFEYGFKYDIQLIKTLYCNMVLSLYELIDMCIVSYSEFVKNEKMKKPAIRPQRKTDTVLVRAVRGYLASYKSGEWAKAMKALKDPKIAAIGESYLQMEINAIANEDPAMEAKANKYTPISDVISMIGDNMKNSEGNISLPYKLMIGVAGFVALLNFLRWGIRWFMRKSANVSSYLERQSELLKDASEAESSSGTSTEKQDEKRQKWYIKMHNMAEFINNKILKMNSKVEEDIMKDSKENFKLKDIASDNSSSNSEITFF